MIHARKDYQHIQDNTGKIREDEPVFLLRAKDSIAPDVVRWWSHLLEHLGGDPETIAAARHHANLMAQWQRDNNWKLPDTPPEALKNTLNPSKPAGMVAGDD